MLATKTFDGNTYIKNESHKSSLGNEEKKAMFSDVSQSDAHFGFARPSSHN